MWLFTTIGFYSVTQVKENPDLLQVRARVRGDLDNLRTKYMPELTPTVQLPGRDYPYRAYTDRAGLSAAMVQIVHDLTYSNFKSEVVVTQGLAREQLYHEVWHVMYNAEKKLEEKERKNKAQPSFGGYDRFWDSWRSNLDDTGPLPVVSATEADNAQEAQEFLRREDKKSRKGKGKGARSRRTR
jgi:hypothetical protein